MTRLCPIIVLLDFLYLNVIDDIEAPPLKTTRTSGRGTITSIVFETTNLILMAYIYIYIYGKFILSLTPLFAGLGRHSSVFPSVLGALVI